MANSSTPILNRIREEINEYSTNNQQIAQVILSQPEKATRMSIGHLAQLANVSDPSILRFCRNLGLQGFKDFKYALAEELAIKTNYLHIGLDDIDRNDSYIHKVASSSLSSLADMASKLDTNAVEKAVDILCSASRIEFWGQATSSIVAADAYQKFFRLGIPCTTTTDTHVQAMSASVMGPGDVLVAISHTGCTQELIRNAEIAKKNGATVLSITSGRSPLAELSSHVVAVNTNEDTDVVLPMISRLAQLLIIDILTVGVMKKKGPAVEDRIRKTKEVLTSIKYQLIDEDK